jgi:hypothetical protein
LQQTGNEMIRTMALVPNPRFGENQFQTKFAWEYKTENRNLQVGDVVSFACNGRGRGGHYNVTARITKINKKTFAATELPRSYRPGTLWQVYMDGKEVYVDLSWKE